MEKYIKKHYSNINSHCNKKRGQSYDNTYDICIDSESFNYLSIPIDYKKINKIVINYCGIKFINDISHLVNLQHLDLRNNHLTDITSLSSLVFLRTLYLDDNLISDISPLKGLPFIRELRLSYNIISDTSPLSSLTSLKILYLDGNPINILSSLKSPTELSIIDVINYNNLNSLNSFIFLKNLFLDHNKVYDISPLSSLNLVENLWIHQNIISDVSPIKYLPLSCLCNGGTAKKDLDQMNESQLRINIKVWYKNRFLLRFLKFRNLPNLSLMYCILENLPIYMPLEMIDLMMEYFIYIHL